jgi:23S rRNA (cytidine2498-2'-O)-methyltransferase
VFFVASLFGDSETLYNEVMPSDGAQFVFMTCRPGAEGAVKDEVAQLAPDWRFSFSRTGFLTFKVTDGRAIDDRRLAERSWTFAHAHGVSLGRLSGESLADLVQQVWKHDAVETLVDQGSIADIHVWQREMLPTDDRDDEQHLTPLCQEIQTALRSAAPDFCAKFRRVHSTVQRPAPRNGLVLDIIVLEPGEWWIGYHRAVRMHERWPGGVIPVRLPFDAVSRAYAKMEEALEWSGLPIAAGDECVEIGCAPGGASQALLDRGLYVTGIDPAEVDPSVLARPRFRHLKKRGTDVRKKEFEGVRWLAADMNIAPQATLDEVEAIVTHPGVAIRGMVLTLKFSDWKLAASLPDIVARVRGWGYREVRTRQLVTGGQEVCLVALRRKALRRLGAKPNRKRRSRSPSSKQRRDEPHPTLPGPHF